MNSSCIFLLALALFGAVAQAYIAPVCSAVDAVGYNGLSGVPYGTGYGVGYGAGYEGGYGYPSACVSGCGAAAVCDTCQCVKTIVRPQVERIPYSCSRRVQASGCRTACGPYSGGVYGNTGAGYLSGGYLY